MDYEQILKEQLDHITEGEDLGTISENAYEISGGLGDAFTLENILNSTLSGESIFQSAELITGLKQLLLYEIRSALILSAEILSICIIMGLLKSLSDSFKSKSISELTLIVCTMVITGISVNSFRLSYELALDSIAVMVNTMEILMPVLIGVLLATGSVSSGTILSPVILASVTGFSYFMKAAVMPALFLSTVLSLLNCLTEKDYVKKLAKLLRSAALFLTGLVLTVLSGIMAVQGLLTETADGLLINTAKYSISSFIPIVGGFTSDTIELFLRCMTSIRSILGVFGILALVVMMAVPLLKILTVGLIYKLTAAAAEPVSDSKISDGLNEMGSSIISMASILFFTSLLFIIFISIIVGLGGSA